MQVSVALTPVAESQCRQMHSAARRQFDEWTARLKREGCGALDYRLTGDEGIERLCVSHLHGRWRVVVAFETPHRAVVVLVGEHLDDDPGLDVYTQLYALAGIGAPTGKRTKPPCCSVDGTPPVWGDEVDHLARRARSLTRPRRQRGRPSP